MAFRISFRNARVVLGFLAAALALHVILPAVGARQRTQSGDQTEPTTQPAAKPRQRVSRPMFSAAYTMALRDILDLEAEDAAALEQHLLTSPDDWTARLKVMAYYGRADQAGREESRERRARHALWLIEHHPDSEILGSPYASFAPGQLTADELERANALWESAARAQPSDDRVMWNAAQFFRHLDQDLYAGYLRSAAALDPDNERYGRDLGLLYASAIIDVRLKATRPGARVVGSPAFAQYAMKQLDSTTNPAILEAATRLLQSQYNQSLMLGRENPEFGSLAQRYFRRAKALDPGLDKAWVLPEIDPKMIGMLAPGARVPDDAAQRFEEAAHNIRRLAPDAFPQLPTAVAEVMRRRGCLIPQPTHDGPARNVIRGDFFSEGQAGWAALCSTGGLTAILVFRDDTDTNPEELARTKDSHYVMDAGNGPIVYSREITAVGREFIVRHYRAYGGPEPPPIDHHGIDDAFLEKASIVYYRYQGKWLQLQGAD